MFFILLICGVAAGLSVSPPDVDYTELSSTTDEVLHVTVENDAPAGSDDGRLPEIFEFLHPTPSSLPRDENMADNGIITSPKTTQNTAPEMSNTGLPILNKTKEASAEIRCYCNLPSCVSTSYMCKSKIPGCFSDLHDTVSFDEAIHGCLDLLPRNKEIMCQNKPGGEGMGIKHSLLLCCREDLCNHVDSVNRMTDNESLRRLRDEDIPNYQRQTPSYSSQEVWFKAATIAVPICGFLILLMLIVLAMKILRTDPQALPPKLWAKESTAGLLSGGLVVGHNPGADTSCCGSRKMPLLFQQNDCTRAAPDSTNRSHFKEKNEANAKLNNPTDLIDLHKASLRAPCNLYQPLLPQSHLPAIHSNIYATSPSWPLKNS